MNVYTLKYLKLWENFEEGRVSEELILNCIKKGATIYAYPVSNLKDIDVLIKITGNNNNNVYYFINASDNSKLYLDSNYSFKITI
jgi:hypothetical protein